MELRVWLAIFAAAGAWGTTGVATRAALNAGVPPVQMAAMRALLAATLLYVLLAARGRGRLTRRRERWVTGGVAALFQLALPFVLFTLAYQYASAGFVGLLVALVPLGTAIIAHYLLPDEPMHAAKLLGLLVAFAGVAFLLLSGDSGLDQGGNPLLAAGLSLGAVTSVSFAGVYTKGRPGTYEPTELTWMQFAMGTLFILGAMAPIEGLPIGVSAWGWALIVYLTVVGSITPFLLFYWLLSRVSATKASLVGYVVPLIALVSGIVLLDERLQTGIAVGGALIIIGVVLTNNAEQKVLGVPAS